MIFSLTSFQSCNSLVCFKLAYFFSRYEKYAAKLHVFHEKTCSLRTFFIDYPITLRMFIIRRVVNDYILFFTC